jgi:hypothetical protein
MAVMGFCDEMVGLISNQAKLTPSDGAIVKNCDCSSAKLIFLGKQGLNLEGLLLCPHG